MKRYKSYIVSLCVFGIIIYILALICNKLDGSPKKKPLLRPLFIIGSDTVRFDRKGDTIILVGHNFSCLELSKLNIHE